MGVEASLRVQVEFGGLLGQALDASRRGRLSRFIADEHSEAVQLFAPALRDAQTGGDWYGEHAGKWLTAASRAAARTGDAVLKQRVLSVARFLVAQQQPDGYLGTYAASHRFTQPQPQPPKAQTWDGAPAVRTWDLWVHTCLLLGLLEVHRRFDAPDALQAARRIGDLCAHALTEGDIDVLTLGNHHGLSATVLLEAAVQLHLDTREPRYLALAEQLLARADSAPEPALLQRLLDGSDASEIATGKAYQLLWNGVGLAKLFRANRRPELLRAVQALWRNVREHHLTLGGGPWGGVAHRSREVFNPAAVFSPQGYVETCSTMAWIQLNRELLLITGAAQHAEDIEHAVWNELLGAMAANGEDWCYYVFPNGRRVHTTAWRCCKSSGAMALEELPLLACTAARRDDIDEISLHLHGPGATHVGLSGGAVITLTVDTRYPFDGDIALRLSAAAPRRFVLRLRIPSWATGATVTINGQPLADPRCLPGTYRAVDRIWSDGDVLHLHLPMVPRVHRRSQHNVQESKAPDGSAVKQEVLRHDHIAFTHGPLVYATSLIDGYKSDESLQLPQGSESDWLHAVPSTSDDGAPLLRLQPLHRAPIDFVPYYRAGGRETGAWRLTWMSLAPDTSAPPCTEESLP